MRRRVWIASCLLGAALLCAPHASRASGEDTSNLNQLFGAGKFEDAAKLLEAHPMQTPEYFYNLGTVDYRLGRLGMAVAYLEKANRLQNHDPAIQQNLRAARSGLGKLIGEDRLDPASTSFEAIADNLAPDEVRGGLGLGLLVLALFWVRGYLKSRDLKKTLLRPAGLLGILGVAIMLSLYGAERVAASHPPAVALDRQTIRSGPGDQFVELSEVDAGCKVRLLGPSEKAEKTSETWYQIRFSTSGIGWIRASSLLLL